MSEQFPKVTAPFTADQVASLNAYQGSGVFHEFTCGNDSCPGVGGEKARLVAYADGWHCEAGCGYGQDWAHAIMADWSWRREASDTSLSRVQVTVDGQPVTGGVFVSDGN